MWGWLDFRTIVVFGPIFGLLVVGLLIALRSGVPSLSSHQGYERFMSNLSQLLLRMVGYGIGLLALQRFIGAPFQLSW